MWILHRNCQVSCPQWTRGQLWLRHWAKQHCFHGSPSTSPSPVLPNEFYSHISCLLTFLLFKNIITIKHNKKIGGLPMTQRGHSSQLSAVQSGPAAECTNSGLNVSQQIWFIWTIYKLVMKSIIHLMAFGMMVFFLWFYFHQAQVLRLTIYKLYFFSIQSFDSFTDKWGREKILISEYAGKHKSPKQSLEFFADGVIVFHLHIADCTHDTCVFVPVYATQSKRYSTHWFQLQMIQQM